MNNFCCAADALLSEYSLVIVLELDDAGIGQRMLGHLLDNRVRNGSDVSACKCTVGNMDRVTNACCDDLCIQVGNCEDISDLTDQVYSSLADVVETAKERRNVSSACACSQQSLVCGEDQGY